MEAAARRSGGGGVSTGVCGVSECACVQVGHLAGGGGRNFAECQITALGKAATALPSAMLAALGKARISFQNPSIQNLFKHISLIII